MLFLRLLVGVAAVGIGVVVYIRVAAVVAAAAVSGGSGLTACRIVIGRAGSVLLLVCTAVHCLVLMRCGVAVVTVLICIRICCTVDTGTGISCRSRGICSTAVVGGIVGILCRTILIPLCIVFVFEVSHNTLPFYREPLVFCGMCSSLSVIIIIQFYVIII